MANAWAQNWGPSLTGIGDDIGGLLKKKRQERIDEETIAQLLNLSQGRSGYNPQENGGQGMLQSFQNPEPRDMFSPQNMNLLNSLSADTYARLLNNDQMNRPKFQTVSAGEGYGSVNPRSGIYTPQAEGQFKPTKPNYTKTSQPPPGESGFRKVPGTNRTEGVDYMLDEQGQYAKDANGKYITDRSGGGSQPIMNILGGGGKNDLNAALALKKEFRQTPAISYFEDIKPKYDTMKEALSIAEQRKDPESFVAADQALITLYNKMTDPSSVVRESEYARTTEDLSVMSRIKAAVSRWQEGGRLEPNIRKDLMKMGKKFMDVATKRYRSARQDFGKFATDFSLNPDHVTGTDFSSGYSFDGESPKATTGRTVVKKFVSKSTGKTKFIYSDGTEEIK